MQLKTEFPTIWGTKIVPFKPIQHTALQVIQKMAKYAIIPSTWDVYNFTGLEYFSGGTILICSEGACISEIIEDGINGFKYPKEDYVALAKCIRKVMALNSIEYNAMVVNAKNTLAEKLSTMALIEKNLSEYKKVSAQFIPTKASDYEIALFHPSEIKYHVNELLDKQPLKKLITYLFKRIRKKI
jgi:glycosyltransferase involved in cell wall biosynthesis